MYYVIYPIFEGLFSVSFQPELPDLTFENIHSFVFLVLGEDGEAILVDTGFPTQDVRGTTFSFHKTPQQDILVALQQHGLAAADIPYIVQTHLHWDHTANMQRFTHASFYVQAEEFRSLLQLNPNEETYYSPSNWMPLLDRIHLIEGHQEIKPGLRLFLTGEHTPGHQVLEVNTRSGPVILGGDVPFNYDQLWKMVPEHFWSWYKNGPGKKYYWDPPTFKTIEKWLRTSGHYERPSLKNMDYQELKKSGKRLILSHDARLLSIPRIPASKE